MEHKKETYYVGYGTKNKGVISKASTWKALNKGKIIKSNDSESQNMRENTAGQMTEKQ